MDEFDISEETVQRVMNHIGEVLFGSHAKESGGLNDGEMLVAEVVDDETTKVGIGKQAEIHARNVGKLASAFIEDVLSVPPPEGCFFVLIDWGDSQSLFLMRKDSKQISRVLH